MLVLHGKLRVAQQVGGTINKKTGEIFPVRQVLQVETLDQRGLVQLSTITVPDLTPFEGKVGSDVAIPVRAWAKGEPVNLMYAHTVAEGA